MRAMPAGTLDDPTPKFRITVGKSSAVYTGNMTLDEDTVNLPIIASDIVNVGQTLSLPVAPLPANYRLKIYVNNWL